VVAAAATAAVSAVVVERAAEAPSVVVVEDAAEVATFAKRTGLCRTVRVEEAVVDADDNSATAMTLS